MIRFPLAVLGATLVGTLALATGSHPPPPTTANISADEVNQFLSADSACHLYASASSSVEAGRVRESTRTRISRSADELYENCTDMLDAVGHGGCSSVELAGHSEYQACALANLFGVDARPGKIVVRPSDPRLYQAIAACLNALTPKTAPVIFTTCGGVRRHGGDEILPYTGRAAAQSLVANSIQRTVVSALGPCSSDGPGAYCPNGWYAVDPELPVDPQRF